jgi:hypothetical protein
MGYRFFERIPLIPMGNNNAEGDEKKMQKTQKSHLIFRPELNARWQA